jgi:hypothetical protein
LNFSNEIGDIDLILNILALNMSYIEFASTSRLLTSFGHGFRSTSCAAIAFLSSILLPVSFLDGFYSSL